MAATALSHAYPLGTRVNERGHLEVGGCDVVELAERYGTPAYIYAEDDMRARARAYLEAFAARTDDFEVIYGSKALPITAAYRADGRGGAVGRRRLRRRAVSWRCGRASTRSGSSCTATTRPRRSCGSRSTPGIGYLVLDSFAEIELAERLLEPAAQEVLIRVTPGIKPSTHSYVQTGPARLQVRLRPRGRAGGRGGAPRARVRSASTSSGSTPTSAPRSSSSSPT